HQNTTADFADHSASISGRSARSAVSFLDLLDLHRLQHHIFMRLVLAAARNAGDLIGYVLPLDHFAEDGVVSGEPSGSSGSNKELRAVGIGTGIGHCEF